jgi:hypothetical protein
LRPEADKALKLYNNKSIANYKTVLKIITQLSGRGGSQSSAIESIKKYEKTPSYFKTNITTDIKNMFVKGKTSMMKANKEIKSIKQLKSINEYLLTGHVISDIIYNETGFMDDTGIINKSMKYIESHREEKKYFATTKQEATNKFKNEMKKKYTKQKSYIYHKGPDGQINKEYIDNFKSIYNLNVKNVTTYNSLPKYEYYVKGTVYYQELWEHGEKSYKYTHKTDEAKTYFLTSEKEAINQFINDMIDRYTFGDSSVLYSYKYIEKIKVNQRDTHNKYKVENILMRKSKHMSYDFILEDTRKLSNNDMCTVDNFLGTYQPLIKKLSYNKFIELCYASQNIQNPNSNTKSRLDDGLDDDEDDDNDIWKISDGVSPKMMHWSLLL